MVIGIRKTSKRAIDEKMMPGVNESGSPVCLKCVVSYMRRQLQRKEAMVCKLKHSKCDITDQKQMRETLPERRELECYFFCIKIC